MHVTNVYLKMCRVLNSLHWDCHCFDISILFCVAYVCQLLLPCCWCYALGHKQLELLTAEKSKTKIQNKKKNKTLTTPATHAIHVNTSLWGKKREQLRNCLATKKWRKAERTCSLLHSCKHTYTPNNYLSEREREGDREGEESRATLVVCGSRVTNSSSCLRGWSRQSSSSSMKP